MKNNITELVIILDRSGSMSGLESDTIGAKKLMPTTNAEEKRISKNKARVNSLF